MYPATNDFFNAIRGEHTRISTVDIIRQGRVLENDIPVISGSYTDDITASIKRRCSLAISGKDLKFVPGSRGDLLWPVGNELILKSGIEFPDGSRELLPQGIFRISHPTTTENEAGLLINVDCYDRSREISRARFTEPWVIDLGTNVGDAIKDLIFDAFPTIEFDFVNTDYTTPQIIFAQQDDRWIDAQSLATNIGMELSFNLLGVCRMRPTIDPSIESPSWTYTTDEWTVADNPATFGMKEVSRNLDDELSYNGVIVNGENPDGPVLHAEAWDTDPTSATFYDPIDPSTSLYGPVPYFYTSQLFTAQQQAQDTANSMLLGVLGILEQVSLSTLVNAAHESGDVAVVKSEKSKINSIYIFDSLSGDLSSEGTMSVVSRKRQVING